MSDEHGKTDDTDDLDYADHPYEEEAGAPSIDFWGDVAEKDWRVDR